MILPQFLLDQIKYYEVKLIKSWPNNTRHKHKTCIIIHWKNLWKIRTKFTFSTVTKTTSEGTYSIHYSINKNYDHLELENQLANYFKPYKI